MNPITGYLRTDNITSPAYYSAGNGTTLNEQYVIYNATDPQNPDPISANNMVGCRPQPGRLKTCSAHCAAPRDLCAALHAGGSAGACAVPAFGPPVPATLYHPLLLLTITEPALRPATVAVQIIVQSRFNGQFCRLAPNIVNLTVLQLTLLCDQPTINLAMQFNYTGEPRLAPCPPPLPTPCLACKPWPQGPLERCAMAPAANKRNNGGVAEHTTSLTNTPLLPHPTPSRRGPLLQQGAHGVPGQGALHGAGQPQLHLQHHGHELPAGARLLLRRPPHLRGHLHHPHGQRHLPRQQGGP
jgi:hypothetical protein